MDGTREVVMMMSLPVVGGNGFDGLWPRGAVCWSLLGRDEEDDFCFAPPYIYVCPRQKRSVNGFYACWQCSESLFKDFALPSPHPQAATGPPGQDPRHPRHRQTRRAAS